MAKFIPRRDVLDQMLDQKPVTVPTQSYGQNLKSLIKVPYRSMLENEELIVRVMQSTMNPLPRSKIAKLIGRKKSPGINRLIENLVGNGILCKHVVIRPNGVDMYLYEIQRWG